MTNWRAHPKVKQRAKELRKAQTPEEQWLWRHLKNRQLDGAYFRRQHPIGGFVLDFYCTSTRLAIEVMAHLMPDKQRSTRPGRNGLHASMESEYYVFQIPQYAKNRTRCCIRSVWRLSN